MKSLVVDTAITKITVSARNEDKTVTAVFDIGMKQSETLLPAIDYVLSKCGMTVDELEKTAICAGPGSFTGLRLGFSALKAVELASYAPIYAFDTLDVYAQAYKDFGYSVLSAVDAKKDRFYAKIFNNGDLSLPSGDYTPEEITEAISRDSALSGKILICGPDSEILKEQLDCKNKTFITPKFYLNLGEIMFDMLENAVKNNMPPLQEYDGPVYLRASEAEVKLNQ